MAKFLEFGRTAQRSAEGRTTVSKDIFISDFSRRRRSVHPGPWRGDEFAEFIITRLYRGVTQGRVLPLVAGCSLSFPSYFTP